MWIVGVGLLIYLLYLVASFFLWEEERIQGFYLIPEDAIFFMEMDKPIKNLEVLAESQIWDHFQTQPQIREMSAKLNSVDSLFQDDTDLFKRIGDRDLIISAHMIAQDDYAFLYIADLRKWSRLSLLKSNINQFFREGYEVTSRTYKEVEITEVTDQETFETLSLAFIKNQLIASYTPQLVEKSVDASINPQIGRNLQFLEVQRQVRKDDLFRFYLNHQLLSDYWQVFSKEESAIIQTLEEYFDFSGFKVDVEDDRLLVAQGASNGNGTLQNLITALDEAGTGSIDATTVLPQETALYASFGFNSFLDLHDNFYGLLEERQPEMVKEYRTNRKKVENFLDIDLQADFYNWMGDELALVQCGNPGQGSGQPAFGDKEGLAVVIKANDIAFAKASLEKIQEKIRKKTPVKFQEVPYRDHKINYLQIKGFFQLILGSLFEDIEKPYYSIIDEFVVFSNSPRTIKLFIDGYEDRTSLIGDETYREFVDHFSSQSNIFLYVNTNKLANASERYLTPSSRQQLRENRSFYSQFTHLGLELKAEKKSFETRMVIAYDPDYDIEAIELEERTRKIPLDLVNVKKEEIDKATVFDIPPIFPSDFTASYYEEKHLNGKTKMKVRLKDGIPDGRYRSYYFDGQLRISGRFDEGEQAGRWKAYLRNGTLFHKKRF